MSVLCVFFLFILDIKFVGRTSRGHTSKRKVTQDFSSTFLLRCVPEFFSREGFSHSFPSSTESRVLSTYDLIVLHLLGFFFFFSEKKSRLPGFELTSERVRRLRGYF